LGRLDPPDLLLGPDGWQRCARNIAGDLAFAFQAFLLEPIAPYRAGCARANGVRMR
jgi:hypothetical protein